MSDNIVKRVIIADDTNTLNNDISVESSQNNITKTITSSNNGENILEATILPVNPRTQEHQQYLLYVPVATAGGHIGISFYNDDDFIVNDKGFVKLALSKQSIIKQFSDVNLKIDNEISRAKEVESSLNLKIDNEISRTREAERSLNFKIDNETSRAREAENKLSARIEEINADMDFDNYYNKNEVDELFVTNTALEEKHYATEDYVNLNGGKIDIIKVNGTPQEIVDKTIELTIPSIEGLASETFVNTKTQEVLIAANKHTDDRVSGLIGQAPETLDTLKEIADALAEDQTALDTLNLAIGNKVNKTLKINGKTLEQDINLTAADVGALSSFTETDPTVPAWAKAATKPSYNYSEINNTPTIPTVNNSTITIKQGEETKGTFTLNQSSDTTIELDVGGGGSNITLYEGLGQNTDGPMTQKAVTDELNNLICLTATQQNSKQLFKLDQPEREVKDGTEFVIKFNKASYDGNSYLITTQNGNEVQHSLWCQSYAYDNPQNGLPSSSNVAFIQSVQWEANDIVRFRHVSGFTTNTGATASGFIAIENITKNYYYGAVNRAINAIYDEYDNRIYTTYATKDEASFNLPMGAIFKSATPQTSKAFHLLDGSVLDATVDASYQTFINYVNAVAAEYNIAVTDEEYETILATYGQCGKFVVTSTSVRLPIVTKHTEGLTDLTNIGEAIKAGLPNITGSIDTGASTPSAYKENLSGSFYSEESTKSTGPNPGSASGRISVIKFSASNGETKLDGTRQNNVYGKSDTVQTDTIKYPYYIVVSTKEEVLNINTLTNEWEISSTSTEMYFKNNGIAVLTITSTGGLVVPDINLDIIEE